MWLRSVLSLLSASHLFVSCTECHQPLAPVAVRCCLRARTVTNGASLKIFPPHSNSARYSTHGGHASSSMTPHSLVPSNFPKCITTVQWLLAEITACQSVLSQSLLLLWFFTGIMIGPHRVSSGERTTLLSNNTPSPVPSPTLREGPRNSGPCFDVNLNAGTFTRHFFNDDHRHAPW